MSLSSAEYRSLQSYVVSDKKLMFRCDYWKTIC